MPQSTVSACGETCAGVMAAFFGLPTVRRDSLWSGCVCFVMASLRLEYSTFMLFTFVLGCIRVTNGFCFAKLENCRVLRMAHESSFMCCKNFHHVFVMSYNRSPKKKSGNPCFIFPVSFIFQTRDSCLCPYLLAFLFPVLGPFFIMSLEKCQAMTGQRPTCSLCCLCQGTARNYDLFLTQSTVWPSCQTKYCAFCRLDMKQVDTEDEARLICSGSENINVMSLYLQHFVII